MTPNRPQREALNELSLLLFGSASRWRKLQEKTPIFAGYEECGPKTREYKKAKEEHQRLLAEGEQVEFQPPRRAIFRKATIDEVFNALTMQADLLVYANADKEVVVAKAAGDFLAKKLPIAIKLVVSDQEKQEYEEVKAKLPREYHEWIEKMVTAALPAGGGIALSAAAFVKAVEAKLAA